MIPQIDTLSPVFLIPGTIVLVATSCLVVVVAKSCGLHATFSDFPTSLEAAIVASTAAAAYTLGYAVWGWKSRSSHYNNAINTSAFRYIAFNHELARAFIELFRKNKHDNYASIIKQIQENENKARHEHNNIVRQSMGSDYDRFKLMMQLWDAIYEQNNPHFIGRMLSSWNNYKFCVSIVGATWVGTVMSLAAILYVPGAQLVRSWIGLSVLSIDTWYATVISWACCLVNYLVLYVYENHTTPWRAETFARDVVYGLRRSTFGGLKFESPQPSTVVGASDG